MGGAAAARDADQGQGRGGVQVPGGPDGGAGRALGGGRRVRPGVGALAVFFPYNGKPVPRKALFDYTLLYVFFHLAM